MFESVTIPEERSASYLNRHLLTGAKVGAIGALGLLAASTGGLGLPAGLAAGAIFTAATGLGAIGGKEIIARNQLSGRAVSAPSIFNEGTAQGLLNGAAISTAIAATALISGAVSLALTPMLIIGGLGAAATGLLAYHQGKNRLGEMAFEFEDAKHKAAQMQKSLLKQLEAPIKAPEIDGPDIEAPEKVTKADMDEIERRTNEGSREKTREWAEKVQQMAEDEQARQASV